jgi:hypothetical protein
LLPSATPSAARSAASRGARDLGALDILAGQDRLRAAMPLAAQPFWQCESNEDSPRALCLDRMLFRLMGLDVLGGGDICAQYDQAENNQQKNKRCSKSHCGSRRADRFGGAVLF